MAHLKELPRYQLLKRQEEIEPRYGVWDDILKLVIATGTREEMVDYIRAKLNE